MTRRAIMREGRFSLAESCPLPERAVVQNKAHKTYWTHSAIASGGDWTLHYVSSKQPMFQVATRARLLARTSGSAEPLSCILSVAILVFGFWTSECNTFVVRALPLYENRADHS